MKITDIEKRFRAATEAREKMAQEKETAFRESSELKRRAEDAADAGDLDAYLSLKQQAERAEAAAYVRQRQLAKKDVPVTQEEINEAWKDYVTGYAKKLTAMQADYQKAKAAALSAFREMVGLQREALGQRQKLADLVGVPAVEMGRASVEIEKTFPMAYIEPGKAGGSDVTCRVGPLGVLAPDLAFYIVNQGHGSINDLCNDDEIIRVLREIRAHYI